MLIILLATVVILLREKGTGAAMNAMAVMERHSRMYGLHFRCVFDDDDDDDFVNEDDGAFLFPKFLIVSNLMMLYCACKTNKRFFVVDNELECCWSAPLMIGRKK
jgi:hypothetical protein